ncbi:MAG: hypothetical protein V7608_6235 [Hyphomicrobiales bacterium]
MATHLKRLRSMTEPPPPSDPFARLRAVSRAMVVAVTVAMVALVALAVVVFLLPALTRTAFLPEVMPFGLTEITPRARLLGFAVLAAPIGLFLYGLYEIRCLFGQYAAGEVLTLRAARRLKHIAWATIIGAIARPLSIQGLFLALSIDQPNAKSRLPAVTTTDLTFLLFGLLLLAIAWAMAEAARIAEEHRQII